MKIKSWASHEAPGVFTQALSDLGCSPSEAVMIGDVRTREPGASSFPHNHLWVTLLPSALLLQDVRDDVGGAQDAGMLGILVRTGKNKPLASGPQQAATRGATRRSPRLHRRVLVV